MEQQALTVTREELITLIEAANRTPGRPSTNCVWRWCRKGVLTRKGDRIRLQHARIGGKLFTSAVWLDEFGQRVAAADAEYFDANQPPSAPFRRQRPLNRYEQQRQDQIDRARCELDAAGI